MFKYINMPKLVAFYLRDFCYKESGEPTLLYRFVFCLCLPFISGVFRKARLNALAIAECTNSADQILRVLSVLTGAKVTFANLNDEFFLVYDDSDDYPVFAFDGSVDTPLVPYATAVNAGVIYVDLQGASRADVEAYYALLVPFYIDYKLIFI